jgi:hypothetical protein
MMAFSGNWVAYALARSTLFAMNHHFTDRAHLSDASYQYQSRFPFLRLQGGQSGWRFSRIVFPPRENAKTWSI